jgi:dolichol-phosphate mannosyltransferase
MQAPSSSPTLSVVIPAYNEEGSIEQTVRGVHDTLRQANVPHEIVVVNDHSDDRTKAVVDRLADDLSVLRCVPNQHPRGFGFAVRTGLAAFQGDAVCIVMADASDDPNDIVKYYRCLEQGYECAFGTRFRRGSVVRGYPWHKLVLNRFANSFVRLMFGLRYNDMSNAFKCYRRGVIDGIQPILACHFNITVELPLKAITRGYSYCVVRTNWYGRAKGLSKLKIKEMGSRYLFIVLYVFLERLLSRGDYQRGEPRAALVDHQVDTR